MRDVLIKKGMTKIQREKASAIAIIHDSRHWASSKKLYITPYGTFAVRAAKTIIVRLVK